MPWQCDKTAVKNLFHSGNSVLNLIQQFNALPASYAHPSWFQALMPQDVLSVLRKTRRGTYRLSKILLKEHGLVDNSCYDFDSWQWRFALLPTEVVGSLALYCGLAFHHRQVSAMVDKSTVAEVKKDIGEHAYTFAVKRAPLVIGQRDGIAMAWDGRSGFCRFIRDYGAVYFLSHFKEVPKAVAGRLMFKFPCSIAEMIAHGAPVGNGWPLFKRILIHEIAPRWQTLFS